jgi:dipeptidase E
VRTILALGGGGFTAAAGDPALDELVLQLAGSPVPRILFLPTASGDPRDQIGRFHAAFGDRPCEPEVLSLFRMGDLRRPLRDVVLSQDVIYVGGGSMRNLLAIWQVHGLDRMLRDAWERGVVLAGLSAGAMCWLEGGVTTSSGAPEPTPGLGLLPGSLSVHADTEPGRRPVYLSAVADRTLPPGWLADDGVGLLFRDMALERVVSARPRARAVRVDVVDGAVVETPIEPDLIAPAPRGVPADVRELRELRATRYGSRRA